ncbi:MAG: hypothetical protein JRH19_03695 [Deltaproteobacteria bacterium]|nr:hypothetical protein [Deltaproteobacteria bacterium]
MQRKVRLALAWILVATLLSYVIFLYYGLGHARGGIATQWWHPSTFLLEWPGVGDWVATPWLGVLALTLPATGISIGIFLTTRSALVRALALSCTFTTIGFAAYGIASPMPWRFFHWRWSLVIVLGGTAMGWASASPVLAARWLERGFRAGLVVYLPVSLATAAIIRGTTGTDESLAFSFSPWPAFPVLGLESGAYGIAGILLGLAAGTALMARGLERPGLALAGSLSAIALPWIWIGWRFGALQPRSGAALALLSSLLLCGALLTRDGERLTILRRRALHLACGAALVALPLFAGHALATGDYATNRFYRSGLLIDALQRFIEEHDTYPPKLEELVEQGFLEEVPRPRVGFSFLEHLGLAAPQEFHYSEFGSGYHLEFSSTEWIQCTYSGSYVYPEDEDEEEEEEVYDDDGEDYAPWNCLKDHPSLWKIEARDEGEEADGA